MLLARLTEDGAWAAFCGEECLQACDLLADPAGVHEVPERLMSCCWTCAGCTLTVAAATCLCRKGGPNCWRLGWLTTPQAMVAVDRLKAHLPAPLSLTDPQWELLVDLADAVGGSGDLVAWLALRHLPGSASA